MMAREPDRRPDPGIPARAIRRRNAVTVAVLIGLVAAMGGLVSAAWPLYALFCRATGYGGTTRVAAGPPAPAGDASAPRTRPITVRFNADIHRDMPWQFAPLLRQTVVTPGESVLAVYRVTNPTRDTISGTATYNVAPARAGRHVNKVECFCFTEQTLPPLGSADLPVTFFIDPGIADDPETADLETITLSYTFFRTAGDGVAGRTADTVPPALSAP